MKNGQQAKAYNRTGISIAILGSGNGSNFQAVANSIASGKLNAKICCVLSDVSNAFILERACKAGIPSEYIDHTPYKTKLDGKAELKMLERLRFYKPDLIVLAGYIRMIKHKVLKTYPSRIINIHPSLLPAFPGIDSWKQALDYGVKITGCTVHFVDEGMDTGHIILQRPVPVLDNDTPESLHARIQDMEHIAYPEAIGMIISGYSPTSRAKQYGK